jgi:5-methylcytosine-specific restriction endonuclease McrA
MTVYKKNREIIFNKYNGRCAYCGCELQKGWHVDELLPVHRKRKFVKAGFYNKKSGLIKERSIRAMGNPDYEWRDSKWVSDGMKYPERLNINNQMPACPSCNINKHSMSLEDFRSLISGFMKHLNEVSTQYKIAKRYGLITETIKPIVFYYEIFKV